VLGIEEGQPLHIDQPLVLERHGWTWRKVRLLRLALGRDQRWPTAVRSNI